MKAVQKMLGHASAAMTLDVYGGLFDDELDAVAERMHDAASKRSAPQMRPSGTVTPITLRENST